MGICSIRSQLIASLRIIKRRLAILIGVWVAADEEIVKDALVWQILMHLLTERGDATDMAVQLCAANAVKEGVDVSSFEKTERAY